MVLGRPQTLRIAALQALHTDSVQRNVAHTVSQLNVTRCVGVCCRQGRVEQQEEGEC